MSEWQILIEVLGVRGWGVNWEGRAPYNEEHVQTLQYSACTTEPAHVMRTEMMYTVHTIHVRVHCRWADMHGVSHIQASNVTLLAPATGSRWWHGKIGRPDPETSWLAYQMALLAEPAAQQAPAGPSTQGHEFYDENSARNMPASQDIIPSRSSAGGQTISLLPGDTRDAVNHDGISSMSGKGDTNRTSLALPARRKSLEVKSGLRVLLLRPRFPANCSIAASATACTAQVSCGSTQKWQRQQRDGCTWLPVVHC
jgi:hypothetical protein